MEVVIDSEETVQLIDVYIGEAEDEEQNGGITDDGNEPGDNDVNDDEEILASKTRKTN